LQLMIGLIGVFLMSCLMAIGAVKSSPYVVIGGLLAIFLMVVLIQYPSLGLLITAFVVPLERFGRFGDDASNYTISLMRVIGIVALAAVLIHCLVRKEKFVFGLPLCLYGGFVFLALASLTHTSDFSGTVRACGAILANIMFFFMVINLTHKVKLAYCAVLIWMFVSVGIGIYSIYDWHFGAVTPVASSDYDRGEGQQTTDMRFSTVWQDAAEFDSFIVARSMGSTSHAGVYGINLIMTIPFFLFFMKRSHYLLFKGVLLFGLLIIGYNVFLTNTRTVLALAVFVIILCLIRQLIVMSLPKVVIGVLLAASIVFILPGAIFERALNPANYSLQNSATMQIRLAYWRAGLEIIQDNWLIGVGVGNDEVVPKYAKQMTTETTTVHNIFIQIAMEVGIFGWLIFFGFVSSLLWYGRKASTIYKHHNLLDEYWFMVAAQIAMISVLVYGLVVDVFHFPLKGWWMIAALVYAIYHLALNTTSASESETVDSLLKV